MVEKVRHDFGSRRRSARSFPPCSTAAGCRRSLEVGEARCTKAVEVVVGVEPVEREVVAASTAAVAVAGVGEAEGRQPSVSIRDKPKTACQQRSSKYLRTQKDRRKRSRRSIAQKEGNGSIHMGFALSDCGPKALYIRKILHHRKMTTVGEV